jgi:AcrR family transcriptional regulator
VEHDVADAVMAVLRRAETARGGGRREGDDIVPLGPRGAKTRRALLAAGYEQLVERGYVATSVEHIHAAAGVSLGTYYQYFRDKADLMATLVGESILDSADALFRPLDLADGESGITRLLEGFVESYARTSGFQRVWEEATHVDDELAAFRRDVSTLIEGTLSDAVQNGQRLGVVDPSLDPVSSARALAGMVDRYCYLSFVVDPGSGTSTAEAVRVLARLWVGALGLRSAGRRRPLIRRGAAPA